MAMLTLYSERAFSQGMAINTSGASANSSAIPDVNATSQGMLVPRMTQLGAVFFEMKNNSV
jgi:hypothetical protein